MRTEDPALEAARTFIGGRFKMRILFSGGGTAGHINPAVAIARAVSEKEDCEAAFVGTDEGLESELIPRLGYKLYKIKVHGFERSLKPSNIKNLLELPKSISDSKKIIKDFKPDIAIGTGGYVAGPVLYAAAKLKIPTLIHESNAYPGITTKILSRYVDTVALGAENAKEYLGKAKRIVYTGNPVRPSILSVSEFEARRRLGLDNRPFIVIFGGSMGARDFNRNIVDWICKYASDGRYQIMMGTGKFHQYDTVIERFKAGGADISKIDGLTVSEYIYDMDVVMSAADLVISRAGASTLSELTALGKPAVLVPSPYVTANHQEHNARAVESKGGARVILESELSPETIEKTVSELTGDKDKLRKMRAASKACGTTRATEDIYNEMKRLLGK